jgi:bacillithiol biosynthesis cysteine-adding enzyme BshC
MTIQEIPFNNIPQFSERDIRYQVNPEQFSDYYAYEPTLEGLKTAINDRKNYHVNRSLIVDKLKSDYKRINANKLQIDNIESLNKTNTFTVVTAHQPSLLTGPLYYVTKLFSAVKLASVITNSLPDVHIVPIFINGSEDHDFEEINHLNIFGKALIWENEERGPIGRKSVAGLQEVITQFTQILGGGISSKEIEKTLNDALIGSSNYNEFTFKLINGLFGHTGILVLSMDDKDLKNAFIPIIKKEIFKSPSQTLVAQAQEKIHAQFGYKAQAYARDINFFYLSDQSRERIELIDNKYVVLNTNITFTKEEMMTEIESHPERFSPNVIIRPLFQEFLLPNIAYVGGGGELAYWLERKVQFEAFGIFYPVLIRRNSTIIISKSQVKQLEKLNIEFLDIFKDENEIIKNYLSEQAEGNLSIKEEKEGLKNLILGIAEKANNIDPTLKSYVEAEGKKLEKSLDQIEGRIVRSYKNQEEISVGQIKNLKSKLFPNNGIQERYDNYFQFYQSTGKRLEELMLENLNPLNKNMLCFIDN